MDHIERHKAKGAGLPFYANIEEIQQEMFESRSKRGSGKENRNDITIRYNPRQRSHMNDTTFLLTTIFVIREKHRPRCR